MAPPERLLVLLGCGPGIGVAVASNFAAHGFNRVALLSRNAERLASDVASVQKAAQDARHHDADVRAYPADLADYAGLKSVLAKVETELGPPEVVVYNGARAGESKFFEFSEEQMIEDVKISTVSLYTTARWAEPHFLMLKSQPGRRPALLVTSGVLFTFPLADYFGLSQAKASQHMLTMNLAQFWAPKGITAAAVAVGGTVKADSDTCNPKAIAEVFWTLYTGDRKESSLWVPSPDLAILRSMAPAQEDVPV